MDRLERLEQDLRFFRLQLETERDQFRRNLLLGQIRDVELDILHELQRQRIRVEAENRNLQDALNMAMAMKKK